MEPASQLELFEMPQQAPQPRRALALIRDLHVRPDHAVLLMIIGLIGVSVVFATGVERGKQLARTERLLQPSQATLSAEAKAPSQVPAGASAGGTERPSVPSLKTAPDQGPSKPGKTVVNKSRFAVQVVSYSQPQLAQRELQRLQQRGEQAFLVNREGRTALLVGPFPTKDRASAKLANLRRYYQDCFIRRL